MAENNGWESWLGKMVVRTYVNLFIVIWIDLLEKLVSESMV